jgi:tRNA pseudouridine38-40 synthase
MRNIKLVIEYDGTRYAGWQRQENAITVQEEIEKSLSRILQETVSVQGAGRTDAGVHARAQVASFTTSSPVDNFTLQGGLNGTLPEDIVVQGAEDMPPDFHARFSAKSRTYSYTITVAPSALLRNYSWHVKYKLDYTLLGRTTACLLGTHSFRSFCKMQSDVDHYRCTVNEAHWSVDGRCLRFRISANRFLHGMVRALVGTMVDVARGYLSLEEYERLCREGVRTDAGPAAPARGLILEEVRY